MTNYSPLVIKMWASKDLSIIVYLPPDSCSWQRKEYSSLMYFRLSWRKLSGEWVFVNWNLHNYTPENVCALRTVKLERWHKHVGLSHKKRAPNVSKFFFAMICTFMEAHFDTLDINMPLRRKLQRRLTKSNKSKLVGIHVWWLSRISIISTFNGRNL